VLGHLVFAGHFAVMALKNGPKRTSAALLNPRLVMAWKAN
jgi:hypothetical protein